MRLDKLSSTSSTLSRKFDWKNEKKKNSEKTFHSRNDDGDD